MYKSGRYTIHSVGNHSYMHNEITGDLYTCGSYCAGIEDSFSVYLCVEGSEEGTAMITDGDNEMYFEKIYESDVVEELEKGIDVLNARSGETFMVSGYQIILMDYLSIMIGSDGASYYTNAKIHRPTGHCYVEEVYNGVKILCINGRSVRFVPSGDINKKISDVISACQALIDAIGHPAVLK